MLSTSMLRSASILALAGLFIAGCSGGPDMYEKKMEVTGYDFTKHTDQEFLAPPEKYIGVYQSIGTPRVTVWPGTEKKVADDIEPDLEPEPEPEPRAAHNAIRKEATRPNQSDVGRPLPLASYWNAQYFPLKKQVELIKEGHRFLPFIGWPGKELEEEQAVKQIAEWGLPLTVIHGNQWTDRILKWHPEWDLLNDAIVKEGGNTKLDPNAPPHIWKRVGKTWTDHEQHAGMKRLQELYPEPPRVFLTENNERGDITSADRYRELLAALFDGLREGLTKQAWKQNALITGYGGLWPPWDGGMWSFYDQHWRPNMRRYNFFSQQMRFGSFVQTRRRLLDQYPEQWHELIYWDGEERKARQYREDGEEPMTPSHYSGWAQYGMWLMTPRVARLYQDHNTPRTGEGGYWPDMLKLIDAVDRVHEIPVLRRFWRKGELVPNTNHANPFFPGWMHDSLRDKPRYFKLDTSEDPAGTPSGWISGWDKTTRIPVFALARQIGDEYLVYAHAPMGDRQNVEIEIPEYGTVTVDVVREEGSFYHVNSSGEATVVQVSLSDGVDSSPD